MEENREGVARLVDEIRAERDRILAEMEREQDLERGASAQLSEPRDDAEHGSIQHDVDRTEPLARRAARRVDALETFLERAAQGRAGICDRCGGPIPVERLRAVVGTALCVRCAEAVESSAPI